MKWKVTICVQLTQLQAVFGMLSILSPLEPLFGLRHQTLTLKVDNISGLMPQQQKDRMSLKHLLPYCIFKSVAGFAL